MRRALGVPYWVFVGLLVIVGLYVSVFGNLPPYLLLAALVLAIFGAWWMGPRYSWAALVGFGVLPALFLSSSLLEQVLRADWSCSEISFRPGESVGYGGGPLGEEVWCATIPGQLIVAVAVFWAITLLGAVGVSYLLVRTRLRPDALETPTGVVIGAIGVGVILLLAVGGLALSVAKMMAPPSPPERAGLPPNGLPVSCSEGEEDIGIFNGVGDDITPPAEMVGAGWRYVYASTGSGAFSVEALDEDGDTVPSSTVSGVAGDEGRSPRIESQGTFSLKIDADEEVGHTILLCDETHPSGRNRGDLSVKEMTHDVRGLGALTVEKVF